MQTVRTRDGLELHVQSWPLAAARGHVHIVHGLGEHIGRFGALAHSLNSLGWSASGHDHRGHGRSAGPRGGIAKDDDLCDDLGRVIDVVRANWRGRFVLLGDSMGGLVAARFVAEALAPQPAAWSCAVDGLVLASPAFDPGMNTLQKLLLAVMERVAPDFAVGNGLDPAWICRDPEVVRAYVHDALVHDRITARLARFIVDAGVLVRLRAPRWKTPTLLMWAGADRCVAPRGSAEFAAAAPNDAVQSREFPGLAHEIFNEPERDQVVAHLARWLAEPHREARAT